MYTTMHVHVHIDDMYRKTHFRGNYISQNYKISLLAFLRLLISCFDSK